MGVGNFFGMLPMMRNSRLYGVELDAVFGRIAKQLYPKADITVGGFETTDRRDFFDLAIGNVPFGQYQVNDKAYDNLNLVFITTFLPKHGSGASRRCGGFCNLSLYHGRQGFTVRRYLASVLSCWELSVCLMTRSKRMQVPRWYRTSSSKKRDRPLDIVPEFGTRPDRQRTDLPSTGILSTTRKWCWADRSR